MVSVFISYAHADEKLKDRFLVHLGALKREGLIGVWHDRMLRPGDHLDTAIAEQLATADLVILLVSPDFLNSKYCAETEMQRAFARAKQGQCKVAAVILEQCQWKNTPIDAGGKLGDFLATPRDGKAVKRWKTQDQAWDDVVTAVRGLIEDSEATATSASPSDAPARLPIEAQFSPARDIHRNAPLFGPQGRLPIRANCVLVRVVATGNGNVDNCTGWITRLERLNSGGKPIDTAAVGSRPLRWSPQEAQLTSITIRPDVPQDLDVFWCIEGASSPQLKSIGHPPSWDEFFSAPGTYRLTIVVSAAGKSQTKRLLVKWRGRWNDFDVQDDPSLES